MLPTTKNIYSNYTFWNMENNYGMSSGTPLDSLWGESELKFCWSFNPHKVLLSLDDYSGNLGLLESMSFHNQFSVQFSCSFMANSLQPHGLQHDRLPCPSPPPGICSNSCPLSRWCHPILILCPPLVLLSSIFLSILVFSNEQGLFQWVGSLHQVAKVLELQHQSFQWIFSIDFL